MNYYKMQTKNATARKPRHWSYAVMWMIVFWLPFLMVFSWGWPAYSISLLLLLLLF